MNESPGPPLKSGLRPDVAGHTPPVLHGPGPRVAALPNGGLTLVVRLEPLGPPTALATNRAATLRQVKEEVLRRQGHTPNAMRECIVAKDGKQVDEAATVGELGLVDLDFLSVGKPMDVFIAERDWPTSRSKSKGSGALH